MNKGSRTFEPVENFGARSRTAVTQPLTPLMKSCKELLGAARRSVRNMRGINYCPANSLAREPLKGLSKRIRAAAKDHRRSDVRVNQSARRGGQVDAEPNGLRGGWNPRIGICAGLYQYKFARAHAAQSAVDVVMLLALKHESDGRGESQDPAGSAREPRQKNIAKG